MVLRRRRVRGEREEERKKVMPEVGRYERQETEGRKSGRERGEGEKREEECRRGGRRGRG